MAKGRKKQKPLDLRKQLAFNLDSILESFETAFANKLRLFFRRLTLRILEKSESITIFKSVLSKVGKAEITELKSLMEGYYKQIGKTSIKHLNKEIKELTGKTTRITVPDIHEGLRYRAEQIAKKQVTDFKRQLKQKVTTSDIKSKDKAELKRVITKAAKTFVNRHITITSRMESIAAVNLQRLAACEGSKIVKGFQFIAVLDDQTTKICRNRHGRVLGKSGKDLSGFVPPLHFGCRSILSPVTIFEQNLSHTPKEELTKIVKLYPSDFGKSKIKVKAA